MSSNAPADTLNIVYRFSGTVNGSAVSGGGVGKASVKSGKMTADVHIDDCMDCPAPTWVHINKLTGVIPVARCIPPTSNPFNRLQRIQFTRTVRFDATTTLIAHATYTPDGKDGIEGNFTYMGSVPPQVELERIDPTVETWIPSTTPNTIIGHFVMSWVTKDGSRLCGDVLSEYVVEGLHIDQPLFRFITFKNTTLTGTRIHQEEEIVLFERIGDQQFPVAKPRGKSAPGARRTKSKTL